MTVTVYKCIYDFFTFVVGKNVMFRIKAIDTVIDSTSVV